MKYQNKIASKLIAIKEISEIEDNKEKYRNWLNTTSNSPLKSPNYNKVWDFIDIDELCYGEN